MGTIRFFSGSNYSGIKSRTRGPLTLTNGELLAVSSGATLKFRYDSEVDLGRDVFDALAFEISDGELSRAGDAKTGELRYLEALPKTRPLVLVVDVPEMTGQEAVGVRMDMPPGVSIGFGGRGERTLQFPRRGGVGAFRCSCGRHDDP